MNLKKPHLTTVQIIVISYISAVAIATLLLSLPFVRKEGVEVSFIDTLFTAVSAISVTGLSVVNTAETFSVPGIFLLALLLQIGGIGIMALGTFVWLLTGRKIGLKERKLIMTDQNRPNLAGLVALMREILEIILLIEAVGTVILGTYFLRYFPSPAEAYFHGFFAAVSATTNAGFDITGQSLIPFAHDYFVQSVTMVLMLLGAIGFPVLVELKDYWTRKRKGFQFSLFTKVTTVTYLFLLLFGMIFILIFEWDGFLADKTWHEKLFYSLFQSLSSRSTGLTTLDVNQFSTPTLLLMSILMFIGASPSSVGGGIRTTTFALILLGIYSFAKGRNTVKVFKREIYPEDLTKAYIVLNVSAILTMAGIIFLSCTEQLPLLPIVFEVCSAFGTAGLSMGITPDLSPIGKLVIMFLMFVGRIGILSFLFLIRGEGETEKTHYARERMIIG